MRRDPIEPGLPDLFREACESIFMMPMDESRIFVCRSWTSKPCTIGATPACFLVSAERCDSARILGRCVRSVLEWLYLAEGLSREETIAVIATLRRRVCLLSSADASTIFGAVGVPIMASQDDDLTEVLAMPFKADVGFRAADIARWTPQVPNKC